MEYPDGRESRLQCGRGVTTAREHHAISAENARRVWDEWAAAQTDAETQRYARRSSAQWGEHRARTSYEAVTTRAMDALDLVLAKLTVDALTSWPDDPARYTRAACYLVAIP